MSTAAAHTPGARTQTEPVPGQRADEEVDARMAPPRPVDERSAAVPEARDTPPAGARRPGAMPAGRRSGAMPAPSPREAGDEDLAPEPATAAELAGLADALPDDPVDVWGLVHRTQQGDAEAFGELYDHYGTMVYRYLSHRVGDRTLAEDFTSETFVRALRRIDSLSFQGRDVGAWLVTIARNIVRDHVKSSRYRLEVTTADMRDADPGTEGPEDAVISRLTAEQLLACVRQLGSEQQECISLRFLQGLSVAETAAVMGKKDGAIKALQHRAVRRLASLLPEGLR